MTIEMLCPLCGWKCVLVAGAPATQVEVFETTCERHMASHMAEAVEEAEALLRGSV